MSQQTTALARLEKSTSMQITQPQQLAERIREWQQVAHVLSPAVSISALAPQHVIAPSVVVLNPDVKGPDVYQSTLFHGNRPECSLTKVALDKIAASAGASYSTRRTDPRTIPCYWEVSARLTYMDFDGTPRVVERSYELDLRDGSELAKSMKPGELAQARRFGLALCESKACNRCARAAWGIPSKYATAELQKPFITLRVSFRPDMNDPEQRRMVAARALGGAAALYPASGRRDDDVIDVEPQREELQREEPEQQEQQSEPAGQAQASTERKAPEPPPDVPRIVEVREIKNGKRKDGTVWTLRAIKLSDDREGTTLDDQLAEMAEQLCREKAPVEILIEAVVGNDKKTYRNVTELRRWQPGLYDQADDEGEPY